MRHDITANELRSMYIEFFKSKEHKEILGKSLIPKKDTTVLQSYIRPPLRYRK